MQHANIKHVDSKLYRADQCIASANDEQKAKAPWGWIEIELKFPKLISTGYVTQIIASAREQSHDRYLHLQRSYRWFPTMQHRFTIL